MLVSGYGSVRWTSPLLWGPPPAWTKMLAGLVMAPALVLLVAAYLPGRIRATVRHPMMIATLAWTRPKRSPSLLWDGAAAATGLALWWWLVFAGGHLRLFGMPVM